MLPIRPQQPPTNPLPINLLVGWPNGSSGLDNASTITYRQVQLMDSAVRQKIIESAEQRLQFLEILLSGSASTEGLDSNQIKELRKFRKTVEQEKERLPFGERSTNLSNRAQELQASLQSVIELSIQDLAQVRQDDQDDQLQELATAIEKVEKSGVLASIFCPEIALGQDKSRRSVATSLLQKGGSQNDGRVSPLEQPRKKSSTKAKPRSAPLNLSNAKQLRQAMSQLAAQVGDQSVVNFDSIIAEFAGTDSQIDEQIKQISDATISDAERLSNAVAKGLLTALRNRRIALSEDNVAQRVSLIEANINSTSNSGLLGSRQTDDVELQTHRAEKHESPNTTPEPSATGRNSTAPQLLHLNQQQGDKDMLGTSNTSPREQQQRGVHSPEGTTTKKTEKPYNPREFVIVLRESNYTQEPNRGRNYKLEADKQEKIFDEYERNSQLPIRLNGPRLLTSDTHFGHPANSFEAFVLNQTVDEIIFENIQEAGRKVFAQRRSRKIEEAEAARGEQDRLSSERPPLDKLQIARASLAILDFAQRHGRVSNLEKIEPASASQQAIEELEDLCTGLGISREEAGRFSATCQRLNERSGVFTGRYENLKKGAEKNGNRLAYTSDSVKRMMMENLQDKAEISRITEPTIAGLDQLYEKAYRSDSQDPYLGQIEALKRKALESELRVRDSLENQRKKFRYSLFEQQAFQLEVDATYQNSSLSRDEIKINRALRQSLLSDSQHIIDLSEASLDANRSLGLNELRLFGLPEQDKEVVRAQTIRFVDEIRKIDNLLQEVRDRLSFKIDRHRPTDDLDEEQDVNLLSSRKPSTAAIDSAPNARASASARPSHTNEADRVDGERASHLSSGGDTRRQPSTAATATGGSSPGTNGRSNRVFDSKAANRAEEDQSTAFYLSEEDAESIYSGKQDKRPTSRSHFSFEVGDEEGLARPPIASTTSIFQASPATGPNLPKITPSSNASGRSRSVVDTPQPTAFSSGLDARREEEDLGDDQTSVISSNAEAGHVAFDFGQAVKPALMRGLSRAGNGPDSDDDAEITELQTAPFGSRPGSPAQAAEAPSSNQQPKREPASRSGTPSPVTMTAAAPSRASTQPQAQAPYPSSSPSRPQSPVSIPSRTTQGAGLQDPSLQSASVAGSGHSSGNRGGGSFLNRLGSATISAASAIGSAIKVKKGGGGGGRDDA
jgi:hypothetical protein